MGKYFALLLAVLTGGVSITLLNSILQAFAANEQASKGLAIAAAHSGHCVGCGVALN